MLITKSNLLDDILIKKNNNAILFMRFCNQIVLLKTELIKWMTLSQMLCFFLVMLIIHIIAIIDINSQKNLSKKQKATLVSGIIAKPFINVYNYFFYVRKGLKDNDF